MPRDALSLRISARTRAALTLLQQMTGWSQRECIDNSVMHTLSSMALRQGLAVRPPAEIEEQLSEMVRQEEARRSRRPDASE